ALRRRSSPSIIRSLTMPVHHLGGDDSQQAHTVPMSETATADGAITLADPVPRFGAQLVTGGGFDLHVFAGRWVVLSFLGSPRNPRVDDEIASLLRLADLFGEDRIIVRCILTPPPDDAAKYAVLSSKAFAFIADYDGTISRVFGAHDMPRTVVLDPLLRAIAN